MYTFIDVYDYTPKRLELRVSTLYGGFITSCVECSTCQGKNAK